MSSNDLISNLKYYGKFLAIIVVIFILLKFIMNLKIYESLLLALIITVSILIVENLIYINDIASDPLNCDQCKVNIGKINLDDNNINDANIINIVPNPLAETQSEMEQIQNSEMKETFISDSFEKIIDGITNTMKKDTTNNREMTQQIVNDM